MLRLILFAGLCIAASLSYAQSAIEGMVLDEHDRPLPGAIVSIDETYLITSTNDGGRFTFRVPEAGEYVLRVSFIGYQEAVDTVAVPLNDLFPIRMQRSEILTQEAVIKATRASEFTPMAVSDLSKEDIDDLNTGQDLPYLIRFTPSTVVTSDAGNGIGYTGVRIRGSDASRINVNINGIPLNDPESQAVFWVNVPDFASSVNSVQVQRGVGTSVNGAGAFGGSINLATTGVEPEAFGVISNSFGSFNSMRNSVQFGTGLINDHWAFEGRLSQIQSDGYIDRATADLKSYYLSGAYYGEKTTIKAITFAGKEVTYQSWYGTPESRLENDEEAMLTHAANEGYDDEQLENLLNSGRTYNFYLYDNEVDNYAQDHYQLHISQQLNDYMDFNISGHYTWGRGYFEQYRKGDDLEEYGIAPIEIGEETISQSDLIRRRWLDNDFYGMTFSLNYNRDNLSAVMGGAVNRYDGDHFGEVIWARYAGDSEIRDLFYLNNGLKDDANIFVKANYTLNGGLSLFGDIQVRQVNYVTKGLDIDGRDITLEDELFFLNPKAGLNYQLNESNRVYASYSVANREPTRNDYIDAPDGRTPDPETLYDLELGYEMRSSRYYWGVNIYSMDYDNQLVLTGELNDVGSPIRTNVANSFRRGVELEFGWNILKSLQLYGNFTYSQNQVESYTDVLYNYLNDGGVEIRESIIQNTDISFSPDIISSGMLTWKPISTERHELELSWMTQYVGEQFLDNTSNPDRIIEAYLVNDVRLTYTLKKKDLVEARLNFWINNILDEEYSSNGYTYSYGFEDFITTENFYYPQAPRNFMVGLELRF